MAPRKSHLRRSFFRLSGAWIVGITYFWFANPTWLSLGAGGAFVFAGIALRGWAAGILEKDRELATSGPYAWTRNPLYLGSFLIGVGMVVAGRQPWFFVVFALYFAVAYRAAMYREAGDLSVHFGERYRHYRSMVPAFFPTGSIYRPEPGEPHGVTPFSLRRYGRNREWEAGLGALLGALVLSLKALEWMS